MASSDHFFNLKETLLLCVVLLCDAKDRINPFPSELFSPEEARFSDFSRYVAVLY